ncbi:7873_t:CDS:2 [Paraglomus brasilianum]|uniref:7873_t:CDS:1 n=1 Tax=Paraglomus brasilianum TaxID=144538 RepID=A0A9N9AP43_9GLOM|nr:7873_t:CDS:2 [Paraglomus brasilianum]
MDYNNPVPFLSSSGDSFLTGLQPSQLLEYGGIMFASSLQERGTSAAVWLPLGRDGEIMFAPSFKNIDSE